MQRVGLARPRTVDEEGRDGTDPGQLRSLGEQITQLRDSAGRQGFLSVSRRALRPGPEPDDYQCHAASLPRPQSGKATG